MTYPILNSKIKTSCIMRAKHRLARVNKIIRLLEHVLLQNYLLQHLVPFTLNAMSFFFLILFLAPNSSYYFRDLLVVPKIIFFFISLYLTPAHQSKLQCSTHAICIESKCTEYLAFHLLPIFQQMTEIEMMKLKIYY